MNKKIKCVFCKLEIKGYGNNPSPIRERGRCCDDCNLKMVIPIRLRGLTK